MDEIEAARRMAFVCDICEKRFSHLTNLARQKKALHDGRSFTCERCGNSSNRKDALRRHMKKHSQEKTHQCKYCSRKFYRRDTCLEHEKLCVNDQKIVFFFLQILKACSLNT